MSDADCPNPGCHYRNFSLKKSALYLCAAMVFLCLAGGFLCAWLKVDIPIGLFTSVGSIAAGGVIAGHGADAYKTFCKSKYFQEDLVGK